MTSLGTIQTMHSCTSFLALAVGYWGSMTLLCPWSKATMGEISQEYPDKNWVGSRSGCIFISPVRILRDQDKVRSVLGRVGDLEIKTETHWDQSGKIWMSSKFEIIWT